LAIDTSTASWIARADRAQRALTIGKHNHKRKAD
jgi:hypothetical protein